jgi:hypothetical protein
VPGYRDTRLLDIVDGTNEIPGCWIFPRIVLVMNGEDTPVPPLRSSVQDLEIIRVRWYQNPLLLNRPIKLIRITNSS